MSGNFESPFYSGAYAEFFTAEIIDQSSLAEVKELPHYELPSAVAQLYEDYGSVPLHESDFELITQAGHDAKADVEKEFSILGSMIREEIIPGALVEEFVEAWRTDNSEVDGERTYSVSTARKKMLAAGYPVSLVNACSTQACVIATDGEVKRGRDIWPNDRY